MWKLVWKSGEGSQDLRPELPGQWIFGEDRESALAGAKSAVSGWYVCA